MIRWRVRVQIWVASATQRHLHGAKLEAVEAEDGGKPETPNGLLRLGLGSAFARVEGSKSLEVAVPNFMPYGPLRVSRFYNSQLVVFLSGSRFCPIKLRVLIEEGGELGWTNQSEAVRDCRGALHIWEMGAVVESPKM